MKLKSENSLKIFFSQTTDPIKTKLGTQLRWVKDIHWYLNVGPRRFQRGNNSENALTKFLNIFSRTSRLISTKHNTESLGEGNSSFYKKVLILIRKYFSLVIISMA